MEILTMIIIALQMTSVFPKKKKFEQLVGSGESFEKLLYYKDCKHNKEESTTPAIEQLKQPKPRNPECPCPRTCCSLCCECNSIDQNFISRQMMPLQMQMTPPSPMMANIEPMQVAPQPQRHNNIPVQPQIVQRGGKKKKKLPKPGGMMQPPIGGRRDLGFTRENIKSLISKDQDIKKILKDLVRVTMHKVDLVEKVNSRRGGMHHADVTNIPFEDDEYGES